MKKAHLIRFLPVFIGLLFFSLAGKSQASWEVFGQKRVQYRTFEWHYIDTAHFRVFYYGQGKANAVYIAAIAEQELTHLVYMMGGRLNKKINVVLYNHFGEYRQTNIGLQAEQINKANGGKLDVVGDNMPVYFNGDHNHLKKQVFKGIATIIKNNMLFGDNVKDVVKNAVKMNLPEWYTEGYVQFIAETWDAEKQHAIETQILYKRKRKFIDLALAQPELVGHSFWHFMATQYGENALSNLLYLTRYRKGVNEAMESVLQKPAKAVYAEWEAFYSKRLYLSNDNDTLENRQLLTTFPAKRDTRYTQFIVSPKGKEMAWVEQKEGLFKVMLMNTDYKKTAVVLEGGSRVNPELNDPDYPLLCWSPSGQKIAMIFQKKNQLILRIQTVGKGRTYNKVIPGNRVDRITGISFMLDENNLAVTAIRKGQSDLYKLSVLNARLEPISFDVFDDKSPAYLQNEIGTGILFSSNRTESYLQHSRDGDVLNPTFQLYLYRPSQGNNLLPLSYKETALQQPIQWGKDAVAYIADVNRMPVRKVVRVVRGGLRDTIESYPSPLFGRHLVAQQYVHQRAMVAEVVNENNTFKIFYTPIDSLLAAEARYRQVVPDVVYADSVQNETPVAPVVEYANPFKLGQSSLLDDVFSPSKKNKKEYALYQGNLRKIKGLNYKPSFNASFAQTTLDNTLLFTRYQPYDYSAGSYTNPPLSGLATASLTDVMEDYKITVGTRLGFDLSSLNYFVQYNNNRRRADWGFTYFHSGTRNEYDQRNQAPPFYSPYPVIGKVKLDYFQAHWSWPFDMQQSIRVQTGIRYDHIHLLSNEQYSLGIPDDRQAWSVSRVEYVYDNTISPIINIWKGSRAKLFGEYQYRFTNGSKGFYNVGYDARNYTTLYKNIILASRIAGAHSFGNAKILYFLGGVDNDLNPQQDNNTLISREDNYAFQSLATNMRGYRQGNRNGNSFLVINEEIRFPIYNTFFKKPIKSAFLRDLQLIAFTDIGSAWRGILPNSDNIQTGNFVQDPNSPVTVFIESNRNDFCWGFGTGLRTHVLGYFLRCDVAWNIDGNRKPQVYLSMATDF